MRPTHSQIALLCLSSLALVHCDSTSGHNTGGVGETCSAAECGPSPGAPSKICADGSVAGPGACTRGQDGKCGWTFRSCPDAGSAPVAGSSGPHSTAGSAAIDSGTHPAQDAGKPSDAGSTPKPDSSVTPDAATDDDAGPEKDSGTPDVDGGGPRCGTRGGVQCVAGQFCNHEPDSLCGATDKGGVCENAPKGCTKEYKPVCGCDNRTYGNACGAHSALISVQHDGLCTPDECETAGGHAVYSNGANIPQCATGEDSWSISGGKEAVICCLGKTQGKTCGGIASLKCTPGEFCNYEPAAGGQGCDGTVADSGGTCQTPPQACTQQYDPVCGCDHYTYGNACGAHSSSVSVLHNGACTEKDCAAIGGHVVDGIGPPPMCPAGETNVTSIVYSNGMVSIEGSACCVKDP